MSFIQIFSSSFSPIQPEMVKDTNAYVECKPQKKSSSLISLLYQFKISYNEKETLPVIPDGCIDILFNLDAHEPTAIVAASPTHRREELFNKDELYFGIRLYPEQGTYLLTCSIKEIVESKVIPLADISHLAHTMLDRLRSLKTFKERVIWVLTNLEVPQQNDHYSTNILQSCLDQIYLSNGLVSPKELSTATGYSDRYIRKIFSDYVGFSPKQFSQIVRLQYSVNQILHNQLWVDDLLDQLNYYDKSHFYKDFKRYMLVTPKEYWEIVRKS